MHTFINCCFSWSPKLAYRLKRLKYCGRCFPLSATSPFSNDNTAIRTCSQRLLPSYPGSGSSLGAQWQKNTTSLPNIDRISGDGATKMYSLSRVGGFRRTLAANHCRTAAEIRICWDNVSYLVETTIIVWYFFLKRGINIRRTNQSLYPVSFSSYEILSGTRIEKQVAYLTEIIPLPLVAEIKNIYWSMTGFACWVQLCLPVFQFYRSFDFGVS